MSVANQNIIIIHREYPKKDFLQIKNKNWQNVLLQTNKDYPALALYLYLASNMDNYRLELSPQAIKNAICMPRSTYYKKLKILKDNGYIMEKQGNVLEFYEVSQKQKYLKSGLPQEQQNLSAAQQNPQQRKDSLQQKQNLPQQNIEINNKYTDNINSTKNTNTVANSRKAKVFIF